MDIDYDEEIPDSFPNQFACSPGSPSLLHNPSAICRISPSGKGFSSPADSQETRLSDEDNRSISPVLELQNHQLTTSFSQATTTCEEDTQVQATAFQSVNSTDIGLLCNTQVSVSRFEAVPSSLVINNTGNKNCDRTMCIQFTSEIENVEAKITALQEKLSTSECNMSDTSIATEEKIIKDLIKNIAMVNKKEKEMLISLRKQGVKVSKERLTSLAQRHRKLVSIIQQQASLAKQIEEVSKKWGQDDEGMSVDENSQSLLPCSIPCSKVESERTRIHSILKKNSDKNVVGVVPTQKKMVKFVFPVQHLHNVTNQTSPVAQRDSALNTRTPSQTESSVKTVSKAVTQDEPMDVSESDKKTDNTVTDSSKIAIHDTSSSLSSRTCAAAVVCTDVQPQNYTRNTSRHDCSNESDDSSSLISGVSGFEPRHQPPNKDPSQLSAKQQPEITIRKEVRPKCTIWSFNTPHLSQDPIIPLHQSTVMASELLNMADLINRQLLIPGRDVMECTIKGRIYKASLLGDGSILSPHGITFHSPMIWMKGLSGLKQVTQIKRSAVAFGASGSAVTKGRLGCAEVSNSSFVKSGIPETYNFEDSQAAHIKTNQNRDDRYDQATFPSRQECLVSPVNDCTDEPSPPSHKFTSAQQNEKLTRKHRLLLVQDNELLSIENIFGGHSWESEDVPAQIHSLLS